MAAREPKNRDALPLGEEQRPLQPERSFFSPENEAEAERKHEAEKRDGQAPAKGTGSGAKLSGSPPRAHSLLTSMDWSLFPGYTLLKARRRFMFN